MSERKELDPETLVQIYDLAEAIEDIIPKHTEFGVVVQALVHVLARGGIQLVVSDRLTKREFVAGVVECLDAHYSNIEAQYKKEE